MGIEKLFTGAKRIIVDVNKDAPLTPPFAAYVTNGLVMEVASTKEGFWGVDIYHGFFAIASDMGRVVGVEESRIAYRPCTGNVQQLADEAITYREEVMEWKKSRLFSVSKRNAVSLELVRLGLNLGRRFTIGEDSDALFVPLSKPDITILSCIQSISNISLLWKYYPQVFPRLSVKQRQNEMLPIGQVLYFKPAIEFAIEHKVPLRRETMQRYGI